MTDDRMMVEDTPVQDELHESFLEYAMSVVVSRALPDARDGLKPVHRRILFAMSEQNLRADRPHVKCARIVGEVMGKFHPHGDTAIYDALVRMAQDFSMRLPLVDGHGNFGTHTDPPAAMRYTEARMAPTAAAMTDELDEETVDFEPNYDGTEIQPTVLPTAFPNLLVNGTSGIAVGMATNMAPHSLIEVVAACRHLLAHPDATVEDLMVHVPGPDLPTGGIIAGLDGVREAYKTGRGAFKMRAAAKITDVSARRKGIVVTELPYQVGPERVIEVIKEQRDAKRLAGVADVVDLTDRKYGLQLVIYVKTGFNPAAVLDELYRVTPLETSFAIHNLALVGGQPRTLNLRDLVGQFVDHRLVVVRRRSEFRKRKAEDRAHILEGYMIALANIEEVVKTIRASKDTVGARVKLMKSFTLTEIQANSILEMPLRRLTSLEVGKIKQDLAELHAQIADLARLLSDDSAMRNLVGTELDSVAERFGTPRRTKLLTSVPPTSAAAAELEIPDEPCRLTLTSSGLLGRFEPTAFRGALGKHDAIVSELATTARATIGLLTSTGRLHRIPVIEVPAAAGRTRGAALSEYVTLEAGERPIALLPLTTPTVGTVPGGTVPIVADAIAMVTRRGLLRRLPADGVPAKSGLPVIGLKDGDELVGAMWTVDTADLLLITSDAQVLRTPAAGVRPQKAATAGGMAGMKLGAEAEVIAFGPVPAGDTDASWGASTVAVVTVTDAGSVKATAAGEYPTKGRGTAGVRGMRFLKGETRLVAAWVGRGAPAAVAADGTVTKIDLAGVADRRDGAGTRVEPAPVSVATARS